MSATVREARERRRDRVRRRVRGTDERPRLSVFRSDRHMYVQVITDESRKTLLAVSTLTAELRAQLQKTADVAAAKQVGLLAARRCQEKGITQVVFDRNGFLYHGRVRAVAEGAREGGLQF
jgi:large subunit ribosomal protein L18